MTDNEIDASSVQSSVEVDLADLLGEPFPKALQKLLTDKKISDEKLHQYCLYAIRQCIEYGNSGFATRLLEMLGKRHATKRKNAW